MTVADDEDEDQSYRMKSKLPLGGFPSGERLITGTPGATLLKSLRAQGPAVDCGVVFRPPASLKMSGFARPLSLHESSL